MGDVVQSLRKHAPQYDVLVIDDGSTDATARIAEDAEARVVRLPFNLGIGGAVQSGFQYALENDYHYAVQVDGDGQHDAREIGRLERAMRDEQVDIVCGSRFLTEDRTYPAPISRRTGIHVFAYLLSRIVGQRVSDPTSGFRLFNRRGIAAVRPRLSTRLPGGGGDAHGALAPPPDVRGASQDVRPERRRLLNQRLRKSAYYMVKVLLRSSSGWPDRDKPRARR